MLLYGVCVRNKITYFQSIRGSYKGEHYSTPVTNCCTIWYARCMVCNLFTLHLYYENIVAKACFSLTNNEGKAGNIYIKYLKLKSCRLKSAIQFAREILVTVGVLTWLVLLPQQGLKGCPPWFGHTPQWLPGTSSLPQGHESPSPTTEKGGNMAQTWHFEFLSIFLTCYSRKSTGVTDNINNTSVPFQWASMHKDKTLDLTHLNGTSAAVILCL